MPKKRLIQLERRGDLHSKRDFYNRRKYDPAELELVRHRLERPTVPASRARRAVTGKAAAACFRMFAEGAELRAIVLALELTPDDVDDLRRRYAAMGRDLLLAPGDVEALRELLDWRGSTGGDLVRQVNARLRYQFERGRQAGLAESSENHNQREVSSG